MGFLGGKFEVTSKAEASKSNEVVLVGIFSFLLKSFLFSIVGFAKLKTEILFLFFKSDSPDLSDEFLKVGPSPFNEMPLSLMPELEAFSCIVEVEEDLCAALVQPGEIMQTWKSEASEIGEDLCAALGFNLLRQNLNESRKTKRLMDV